MCYVVCAGDFLLFDSIEILFVDFCWENTSYSLSFLFDCFNSAMDQNLNGNEALVARIQQLEQGIQTVYTLPHQTTI